MRTVSIPARKAEVLAEADVVVCGGGPAGLGAALAAARGGARVVLLERYGFLGGNFTAAAVGTICGLYVRTAPSQFDFAMGGLARRFAEALAASSGGMGPVPFKDTAVFLYVPWAAKRLADHLVTETAEAERIRLFLHATVGDVVRAESGEISGVVVASKQGPKAVLGKVFVDATGDADVAAFAGVPFEIAPPGTRQFGSMQFFLQHVDVQAAMAAGMSGLQAAIDEHGAHLTRDGGAVLPTFRTGEMIGAMIRLARDGAPLDATDLADLTWGELEGRRRAEEATDFLKAHMPGLADAFLQDTAVQQGVRESRRVRGRYRLTGDDVLGAATSDDAIAACAWPQEYHVSGRSTEMRSLRDGTAYQIPFRILVPEGDGRGTRGGTRAFAPPNLLVAGRCVSAAPDALASCRVMAPCMAMGEAAGTAAAMAARDDIAVSRVDVAELRDRLREAGAILSV